MDWRENIRDLREAKGMTQAELEELSGVPDQEISRIEAGSPFYHFHDVAAIAEALEIDLDELVGVGR